MNGLSFNEHRLKGLNTKSMQCRSAVEHNRMIFNDLLKNVPHFRIAAQGVNQLLELASFEPLRTKQLPDLVLLDLSMPKMNRISVIPKIA